MIEVRELTKRFSRHTAVDNISFSVGKGEIVGFLGPNGAGKTTTMRMLTGYLPATSGSVEIGGHDVFRESVQARRKIGYMPENVPLYEDMRVREYLKFRAHLKGLSTSETRRRVGEVIATCGLDSVRRKMIKVLSKGYRQRVGLADALVHSPDLLILDEPTNGLDPNQIRQIRELIKRLGESHTILLSTHILSEVEMTCGRVIIIDGGKVRAQDSPESLVDGMRTAGKVLIELKADPEVVQGAINRLDHVKRVTQEATGDGWFAFEVLVDSGTDARERIHEVIAQNGWSLRSLHRRVATLEDVFVELTRQD
ncbi:ABC transporter ATP-binding protein [Haloferula rosea]|uniref:ATP-binding cassette domain-containing protein n=1 Tax=Haloferula rosea TaxID=490093 RepID=A0A934VG47_9BACT|nr:ATP-binding cassette domain-containing protein [Haloferula rosea]MBK1827701.1 ATP-binding cassette domain-containing protein [Haloferula rosea]